MILSKIKHIKKRFLLLVLAFFVILTATGTYTLLFGSHFNLHTNVRLAGGELTEVSMEVSRPDVLELEEGRLDGGEIVVRLSSVAAGDTSVRLRYSARGTAAGDVHNAPAGEYTFHVSRVGTIFNTGTGMTFTGHILLCVLLMLLVLATMAVTVASFIEYWRKAEFSYPMIACGGVAMMCAIMSYFLIDDFFHRQFRDFSSFMEAVESATTEIFMILIPVLLVLALLVSLSNIMLIIREGFHPVNALGIGMSILWILGLYLVVVMSVFTFTMDWTEHFLLLLAFDSIASLLIYVMGYFECMILSAAAATTLASRYKPAHDKDYIIILGCAMLSDGTPAPLLRGRVDAAVAFEKEQFAKTGKHAFFVPSGGRGKDEIISEAECMKRYMTAQGVPAEQILLEDKSTNTRENMAFSKRVIEEHAGSLEGLKIAFATTSYHVFRGYILSRKFNFRAEGISAKTKLYFFPNAFLREFVGLVFDRKKQHPIFLGLLILFFTAIRVILLYTFSHAG